MTAGPPIPAHPRLGTSLACRLQRALRPHPGFRWLSARIEASGLARASFTGAERQGKEVLFGCRMCGRAEDLRLLHRPLDYWQGRDEGLWTASADDAVGDTGGECPANNHHRVLGGS